MRRKAFIAVFLFAIGLAAGWWLSAPNTAEDEGGAAPTMATRSSARPHAENDRRILAHAASAEFPDIGLEELAGLHDLGAAPRPDFGLWLMGDEAKDRDAGFAALVRWLDLTPAESGRLAEVLRAAAVRMAEWERRNLRLDEQGDLEFVLDWRPAPEAEVGLRSELDAAFGTELGAKIWRKADLRTFGALPAGMAAGMADGERVELKISFNSELLPGLRIWAGEGLAMKVVSIETGNGRLYKLPAPQGNGLTPATEGGAARFAHLLPLGEIGKRSAERGDPAN